MKVSNTSSRLKELMQKRGIRQIDILNAAKPFCAQYNVRLGKNDLSQYVSGKVEPKQEKLTVLGHALNVSETWLMGYDVPPEREAICSTDELIDLNMRGVKKWATDSRFSQDQKNRTSEYLAELALRLKKVINSMAESPQSDSKILMTPYLQGALDDLSHWSSIALRYVNADYSNDPFDENNLKAEYLSAISKLSRRDQVAWLIRIQDYIDENKEPPHLHVIKKAGRDGSYAETVMTDEEVRKLREELDSYPEVPDDL